MHQKAKQKAERKKILDRVRKNITNWLSGKSLPASTTESRELLYKICFILNLSFGETEWFFNHFCFQRCFNLHIKNEIIYYYCFSNELDFGKASLLIRELKPLEAFDPNNNKNDLFTHEVIDVLDKIHNDEELINFYKSHYDFISSKEQNKWAKEEYFSRYKKLKPNDADNSVREKITAFIENQQRELNIEIRNCSPLIFEQFEKIGSHKGEHRIHITEAEFSDDPNRLNDIKNLYRFFYNQRISTDAFMLRCMYGNQDIDVEKNHIFPISKNTF